jgi:hypothetical protein
MRREKGQFKFEFECAVEKKLPKLWIKMCDKILILDCIVRYIGRVVGRSTTPGGRSVSGWREPSCLSVVPQL